MSGYFDNLLGTVFSGEVGLSDKGIAEALRQICINPDTREKDGIRSELAELLRSPHTDWVALLDAHEVATVQDADAGRSFIVENVWRRLFPTQSPPYLQTI